MGSDVAIAALISSCYSCRFNSLFISSMKKGPSLVWLTVLSPAPRMVRGPEKIQENSLSNERTSVRPSRGRLDTGCTAVGKLAIRALSSQQERGFRMTNVDPDKPESTSHPEICFAIYKGQRGSLANVC